MGVFHYFILLSRPCFYAFKIYDLCISLFISPLSLIYTLHCNVLTTHHDIAAVIYEDECFDGFSNHWHLQTGLFGKVGSIYLR